MRDTVCIRPNNHPQQQVADLTWTVYDAGLQTCSYICSEENNRDKICSGYPCLCHDPLYFLQPTKHEQHPLFVFIISSTLRHRSFFRLFISLCLSACWVLSLYRGCCSHWLGAYVMLWTAGRPV